MKKPKIREIKEVVRALVSRPYTSKFPREPHQPFERFRGKPQFYENDCIGCGACFQVCPAKAIDMQDVKEERIFTVRWDLCIFCGQCQANCLTGKGIILSREFDLATTGSRHDLRQEIKKKLFLCACCQEAIVPYDQLLWVAKRLGPLVFSNPSLMLFYLENLGLAAQGKPAPKGEAEFTRPDRIKVLCPACRREAVLKS